MIVDLHVHSCYSFDSLASPADIVRAAVRRGLNGVAITDHDTIRGGVEAAEANSDPGFLVIVGSEVVTDAGDIVGLFLSRQIGCKKALDVVDDIHDQGGIAILPHPYKGHKLTEEIIRAVDAIEVFNSRARPEHNAQALALARQYGKPMVVGSDAHFLSEIGSSTILTDSSDVRAEILAGRARFETKACPAYRETLSQIVKSAKQRRYVRMPYQLAVLVAKAVGFRR